MYTQGKRYFENVAFPICIDDNTSLVKPESYEKRVSISFIQTGTVTLNCNNKDYVIHAPCVLLQNEDAVVSVSNKNDLSVQSVYFHPSVVNSHIDYDIIRTNVTNLPVTDSQDRYLFEIFGNDADEIRILNLDVHKTNECEFLFRKLTKAIQHNDVDYCPCWMRAVLISLLIFLLDLDKSVEELVEIGEKSDSYNFKDVILYLYSHYREELTVDGLSKVFGTNRTTLNDRFKKTVGSSAMAFLRNIRITAAAKYLRTSDKTVTQVCMDVGFQDVSYFCKLFRRTYSCTPNEYRKMYNSSNLPENRIEPKSQLSPR